MAMIAGFIYNNASAQVRVNVNLNIGSQPAWGPTGYDYVDYYYMPDIDVYYNVPQRQYVYLDGGRWLFAASLPARYRNYDIYRGYKVVVNEPRPYLRAPYYRDRYAGYRGCYGKQTIIRDNRHYVIKEYKGDRGHGNGNGHGNGHGRGHGHGHDD